MAAKKSASQTISVQLTRIVMQVTGFITQAFAKCDNTESLNLPYLSQRGREIFAGAKR